MYYFLYLIHFIFTTNTANTGSCGSGGGGSSSYIHFSSSSRSSSISLVVLNSTSMLMTSLSIQHYQTIVIIYLKNCHHVQMQLIAGLSPISYYLTSLKLCY